MRLPGLLLALAAASFATPAPAQDQGTLDPQPLPPLVNPIRPEPARQGSVWPRADPDRGEGALDRLLLARLPRRRQGAAGRRRVLAGDAAVAQPHMGPSGDDRLSRALLEQGRGGGRLARHSGRRHFAAARRPDADRPRLASGRPRRRHLADADARPHAVPRGARGDVGGRHGARGRPLGRPRRTGRSARPAIIKAAAEEPEVDRIFVNAAIKKALCETHGASPG